MQAMGHYRNSIGGSIWNIYMEPNSCGPGKTGILLLVLKHTGGKQLVTFQASKKNKTLGNADFMPIVMVSL